MKSLPYMSKEINIDQYGEEDVSKRNRRERQESEKDKMIVDSLPPTGIHKEKRKVKDRKINQIIKKALKH